MLDLEGVRRAIPFHRAAVLLEEAHQLLDIGDGRDIAERHRLVGQQAGAEQGQHRILVARRLHLAAQGRAPGDPEIQQPRFIRWGRHQSASMSQPALADKPAGKRFAARCRAHSG